MIELLEKEPWTLMSLAGFFGVPLKVIEDDISHIEKSVASSYKFKITSPDCEACGFIFQKKKLKKPSRCPMCKSERITEPLLELVKKS